MNALTFRNVHIRYADLRRKDESMPFTRLHLTADLSQPVCEAMEWEMPGTGQSDGSLIGKIAASHLVLTPNEKGLRSREIQIECSEAGDFKFVGEKDEDGGIVDTELRFIVRSNQADAISIVNEYWRAVGDSDAQMRLSYQKEPVQAKLEIAASKQKDADDDGDDQEPVLIDATSHPEPSDEEEKEEAAADKIEEHRYPGSGSGCEAALVWRECEGGWQADYMVRFTVGTRDSHAAQLDGAPIRMSEHQAIAGAARNLYEFCGELVGKHEAGNSRVTVRQRNEAYKVRNWLGAFMEDQPGLPLKNQPIEEAVIQ